MTIDYVRFGRILRRCQEVGTEAQVKAIVKLVWDDLFKLHALAFLDAHDLLIKTEGDFNKENKEALQAIAGIDQAYRVARAALAAYQSNLKLPDTLKALPTDTDRVGALENLLHRLEERQAEPWALELLTGEFGTLAPQAIRETNEAIGANKALAKARDARSQAYGVAYERYLAFKRVVREAYGSTSKQYKRIHLRLVGPAEGDEPAPAPVTPPSV
jgi:hypothetical protein